MRLIPFEACRAFGDKSKSCQNHSLPQTGISQKGPLLKLSLKLDFNKKRVSSYFTVSRTAPLVLGPCPLDWVFWPLFTSFAGLVLKIEKAEFVEFAKES